MTAQLLYDAVHISLLVIKMEKTIVPHKKVTLKGKMLRILGLDRGFEQSFSDHDEIISKKDSFDPFCRVQAYIISNRRKHEIELQKAMAIKESRHDTWKAGGPV